MDMEKRLYALVTVGKTISIKRMLDLITKEEMPDLKKYVSRFFVNTHGLSQEEEMKMAIYNQKGMELGWKYLKEIDRYCHY